MFKKIFLISAFIIALIPVASANSTNNSSEPINLYVAADGSEEFQTFEEVQAKIREIKQQNKENNVENPRPITVNFRGGEYFLDSQIKLDNQDSGYENAPITYQAVKNEKVTFIGGQKIGKNNISKVTDQNILNRIIDPTARNELLVLDYSATNIELQPLVHDEVDEYTGKTIEKRTRNLPTVYFGENALTPARYPNKTAENSKLRTDIINDGYTDHDYVGDLVKSFNMSFEDTENRANLWTDETLKGAYIHGYLHYSWQDDMASVKSFNKTTKQIDVGWNDFGVYDNNPFYFLNVLDEIDVAGESYNDLENKKVYFYPTEDYETADVYISTLQDSMLLVREADNLIFKDLDFKYSGAKFLDFQSDTNNITIDNCVIAHNSSSAASFGGYNITIKNSHIYDNANGGVTVYGGSVKDFKYGNNVIENNKIHDNANRLSQSYVPAIGAASMGLVIRNNEIYNNPHQIIGIGSNDIIIEKNEIYNAVLEASDMGAIYYGRDPSVMGIEIRYNYFHDIGNGYGGYGQQAIFADDGAITPHIHHNIFYDSHFTGNVPIKTNGAQFGLIENNIIAGYKWVAYFQSWAGANDQMIQNNWFMWLYSMGGYSENGIFEKITTTNNVLTDLYLEHYNSPDFYARKFYDYFKLEHHTAMQGIVEAKLAELGGLEEVKKMDEAAQKQAEAEVLAALNEYALKNAPSYTNIFRNNVVVGANKPGDGKGGVADLNSTEENTFYSKTELLEDGTSIFKEYGKDFELSDSGLAEVRKVIPNFDNILTSQIGYKEPAENQVATEQDSPENSEPEVAVNPSEVNSATPRSDSYSVAPKTNSAPTTESNSESAREDNEEEQLEVAENKGSKKHEDAKKQTNKNEDNNSDQKSSDTATVILVVATIILGSTGGIFAIVKLVARFMLK
ncbi:MAG: right-handed parallel beta-helix repeat-containing protein [Candidatus Nomurabacteria bacterium]|jgi:hypothetical protein|nr:right-handed parallel beta-helix repeat-containing protein [Candidatus Nomurabacteria bacterium]